ncbi:response regulator transcription factor [Bavariicoccus seileri]|uniref:response regulator transcription factor n=1 Tax=Bavariicoccus seileri TaxID=549685 RepID=UPI0003B58D4A|nr:response regulator transcription factor [Bavariicoccus seileri]
MNILMIEDNEAVCEMMGMFFENEHWTASFIHDGQVGYDAFKKNPSDYDLILLDLNLPSLDGMQICRMIREIDPKVPIIMLTARDSESDQVIGLEIGADDYVTKPFSPLTVIARIKALVRRLTPTDSGSYDIKTTNLLINTNTREVRLYNKEIKDLTPKEFELLVTLAQHPKQVFSREHLLDTVWREPYYGEERTIDAHIKKLRQKLAVAGPDVIQTVWGVGYKFDDSTLKQN